MTATAINAPKGVDNFDWLEAIDAHTETTTVDVLAAYEILGVTTDLTPEQLDASTITLHLLGFLWPIDISDDGRTYTYELCIPERDR